MQLAKYEDSKLNGKRLKSILKTQVNPYPMKILNILVTKRNFIFAELHSSRMIMRGSSGCSVKGGRGRGQSSSSSGGGSIYTTPTSSCQHHPLRFRPARANPFDSATASLPERMQMPTMSPSIFNTVFSPSAENEQVRNYMQICKITAICQELTEDLTKSNWKFKLKILYPP
jgi:hypothetical protein